MAGMAGMVDTDMTTWPQRTVTEDREGVDVTVWDELAPYLREGDIVVNTFMKTGTTWMLQVILQMLNNGKEVLSAPENTIHQAAPWIEHRNKWDATALAKLKATPPHRRRVIKSHLPLDPLLFLPKIRYVCVFRDGRDAAVSLFNQARSLSVEVRKRAGEDDASFEDFNLLFDKWLHSGHPSYFSGYFHHCQSWFKYAKSCDNILLINYSEMRRDLASVVVKLGKFLDIPVDEASPAFRNILCHSSYEYMKQNEQLFEPPASFMKHGSFVHKGVSGRWRDVFSEAQNQMYWDRIRQSWSPELIDFVHEDSSRESLQEGQQTSTSCT